MFVLCLSQYKEHVVVVLVVDELHSVRDLIMCTALSIMDHVGHYWLCLCSLIGKYKVDHLKSFLLLLVLFPCCRLMLIWPLVLLCSHV